MDIMGLLGHFNKILRKVALIQNDTTSIKAMIKCPICEHLTDRAYACPDCFIKFMDSEEFAECSLTAEDVLETLNKWIKKQKIKETINIWKEK